MRVVDLIAKKREGLALSADELEFLIRGYTGGDIPDYQMAAWLMAVCWRGLSAAETATLTWAMARSGSTLDLESVAPMVADKHSTGGVGDGATLVVAPVVAACGLPVAKLSGRGLGFTGGTIDKLEAIPGFRVEQDARQFVRQLREVGLAIGGQTPDLAPADGKIYALRDATATIESIPLIASSVMSKKLAGGATAILLDVKVGRGAFMAELASARTLAKAMIDIASVFGRRASAVLSAMDQPLGMAVGNALEVRQAIGLLRGQGPADILELSVRLASELLALAGRAPDVDTARPLAEAAIISGAALEKLRQMIQAQGGDSRVVDDFGLLPQSPERQHLYAEHRGYVRRLDARAVGLAAVALGAGRSMKGDTVDPAVGVALEVKVGDFVTEGQTLATLHHRGSRGLAEAVSLLRAAYSVGDALPEGRPLVLGVIHQER